MVMNMPQENWIDVCSVDELTPGIGVRALVGGEQVALFKVADEIYAIGAFDPFSHAAVLSRGIVGDLQNQVVVASPIYKQHFRLADGVCLEDESVSVPAYEVNVVGGRVNLRLPLGR